MLLLFGVFSIPLNGRYETVKQKSRVIAQNTLIPHHYRSPNVLEMEAAVCSSHVRPPHPQLSYNHLEIRYGRFGCLRVLVMGDWGELEMRRPYCCTIMDLRLILSTPFLRRKGIIRSVLSSTLYSFYGYVKQWFLSTLVISLLRISWSLISL